MGKFTPAELARYVFARTGAANDDLLVGPDEGEDAAAIRVGEETLVASADPISLAAERIGTLGVAVASNDVATAGGRPEWLVSTILLPSHDPELLDTITAQMDDAAERLGITVVGGHTEAVDALSRPLLSLTCLGTAERFVPTGGANPGDRVLLTKGAGIEGTAVLATDFRGAIDAPEATLDRAADFFGEVSVLPEATALAPTATAMHDPTEGGVVGGLVELARAGGVDVDVTADAIPVRAETRDLCAAMGVDPLRILGSGALLATVTPEAEAEALSALADAGVEASVIGEVTAESDDPAVSLGGERLRAVPDDHIYRLWN